MDLLAIQREIHPGVFTVMDGTLAGNGAGPRTMRPEQKDVLLASADSVAIDAVAAKMMGFDPMSIDYIRLAHQAGLGVGRPGEIEVVGEDVSQWDWGFSVGATRPPGWGAWPGSGRSSPCSACSSIPPGAPVRLGLVPVPRLPVVAHRGQGPHAPGRGH